MLLFLLFSAIALADDPTYETTEGKCRGGQAVDPKGGMQFFSDGDCEQICNDDESCRAYHRPKNGYSCTTWTTIGMAGDGRKSFWCYKKNVGDSDVAPLVSVGWNLKEGCDEDRCSSMQKTKSQDDADACCDFFALDQSIKTKAIMADKKGYNALKNKPWADKLAFVMAATEPECKKEAETCETSSDCCENEHEDGHKEPGVCFDFGFSKGCTICESHNTGDDCTDSQNGGNCVWKDEKCHWHEDVPACKKESETCETSADCCENEHEDGHKEPGVCFDFEFMKGCTVCESHGNADDCTHDGNGGNCVWKDEKCHWHEDVSEDVSEESVSSSEEPEMGDCEMEGMCCPENYTCKMNEGNTKKACVAENGAEILAIKCANPCVGIMSMMDGKCGLAEDKDACLAMTASIFSQKKICKYEEEETVVPAPETCVDDNAGLEGVMGLDEPYDCAQALEDYTKSICSNDVFKPYCCATCAKLSGVVSQVDEVDERPECVCTGDNSAIPKKATKYADTDYGKQCDAWDMTHRYCTNKKSLAQDNRECWCPLSWCYVPADCKTARKSDFFADSGLHYSYAACSNDGDQCFAEDVDLSGLVDEDAVQVVEGTTADFHFNSFEGLASKYIADASDYPYCTVTSCASFNPDGEPKKKSVSAVFRAGPVRQMAREEMTENQCSLSMKKDGGRIEHFLDFPAVSEKLMMAVVTCYSSFENLGREDVMKMFGFNSDRRLLSFDEESYLRYVAKKKQAKAMLTSGMDMLEDLSMA